MLIKNQLPEMLINIVIPKICYTLLMRESCIAIKEIKIQICCCKKLCNPSVSWDVMIDESIEKNEAFKKLYNSVKGKKWIFLLRDSWV